MMEKELTLKIEIGLPSQRIIHHLQTYNADIESQVKEGIDEALQTIDIKSLVKDAIIKDLNGIIKDATTGWQIRQKIKDSIEKNTFDAISDYGTKISEKIKQQLALGDD